MTVCQSTISSHSLSWKTSQQSSRGARLRGTVIYDEVLFLRSVSQRVWSQVDAREEDPHVGGWKILKNGHAVILINYACRLPTGMNGQESATTFTDISFYTFLYNSPLYPFIHRYIHIFTLALQSLCRVYLFQFNMFDNHFVQIDFCQSLHCVPLLFSIIVSLLTITMLCALEFLIIVWSLTITAVCLMSLFVQSIFTFVNHCVIFIVHCNKL